MAFTKHRHDTDHDHDAVHDRDHRVHRDDDTVRTSHDHAYDRFGGTNIGASFFGWLVAIATAVLLTGIIGAIAAGVSENTDITQSEAEREAGTIGLASALVLLAVLLIGYYAGGYVAGRMSRFDGGRQGVMVWVIGLLVTIAAVVVGWILGDQYNVLDRVDLPRIPIPTDELTTGGIITGVVAVLGTLLAAVLGGKVGHRYHDRVDRAAYLDDDRVAGDRVHRTD